MNDSFPNPTLESRYREAIKEIVDLSKLVFDAQKLLIWRNKLTGILCLEADMFSGRFHDWEPVEVYVIPVDTAGSREK